MADSTGRRAGLSEHTAEARRVLLTPEDPGTLPAELRIAAAARAAERTGQPRLAARYRALIPGAVAPEAVSGPHLTAAVLHFTDSVTVAPADVRPDALRDLTARGLDVPAVVALAQICAFVSYEARVVSGLSLLAGGPAVEPTAIPGPAPTAPKAPDGDRFTLARLTWRPRVPAVAADALTPGQQAVVDAHATLSTTSPYYRTLLHDPAALDHRTHVYNAIMYGRGGLPRAERELATLLVSRANGCVYCASVHGRKYGQLSRDEAAARRVLRAGGDALAPDARGLAIARFTAAQTHTPPRGGAADVAALRAAGLSDAELTDLVHAVALFGWANRLMLVLGDAHPAEAARADAAARPAVVPAATGTASSAGAAEPAAPSAPGTPRDGARESCSRTSDRSRPADGR
ncbi:peroxidase-related enzyme [Streptomyces sp. NRRL F-5135]|uniref:peroxidase-related enzyme n=1 Tax=Streptomyces sp. NRRL F-5135 TaxID=1463858 RepID=UPI000690A359|nr:peroxidase-related enzyme [Streptomyces sp. NRRL F-5135]